jgi:nucleotide-binding universal stress UspA family protein
MPKSGTHLDNKKDKINKEEVTAMQQLKNILVCTDFSEDANNAFLHALELAKKDGAQLHILHIPHSPYTYLKHVVDEHAPEGAPYGEAFFGEEIAERATEALKEVYEKNLDGFENYSFVVRHGSPFVEIIRYAKKNDVDKIVMGDQGKYKLEWAERGSTVDNVIKYSRFPVISVNGKPVSHDSEI